MKEKIRPCLPARFTAWILTIFMTSVMAVTLIGAVIIHSVTSADAHIRVATDERVISEQMDRIADDIREIAEEYSFPADEVISAISREDIRKLNTMAAEWWTHAVIQGIVEEFPAWHSDAVATRIEKAMEDSSSPYQLSAEVIRAVEKTVRKTTLPVRESLISFGVRYLEKRIDVPGTVRSISRTPLLGGALILLLSGLIALLSGSQPRMLLKYYGSALAGAGIAAGAALILLYSADIQKMVGASSEGLEQQLSLTMQNGTAMSIIGILIMLAAGAICLMKYSRDPRDHKRGGKHEKDTNSAQYPV